MRLRLAGVVEVQVAGRLVGEDRLAGPQGRLALAYLALERGRAVPRGELADVLWPHALPRTWEIALRVLVSKLRVALSGTGLDRESAITFSGGSYRLNLPPNAILDVEEAASAVETAEQALRAGRHGEALTAARRSDDIASQPLLAGAEGEWLDRRRGELREVTLRAVHCIAEACLERGEPGAAVVAANRGLATDPFREPLYVLLMRAHDAAGSRAEALRAYERCRSLLADELGVSPSPAIQALYLDMLREPAAPADELHPAAPLPAAIRAEHSAFVGRSGELDALRREWDRTTASGRPRLAVVAGEPGIGKTRLVSHFAVEVNAAGGTVLYGRCDEQALAAHQPVVEAVSQLVSATPPARLRQLLEEAGRDLVRLAPQLLELVPGLAEPAPGQSETERFRLFEAASRFLVSVSRGAPVLLVVDDAHWADLGSVLLLRHLLRRGLGSLLVLVTYRDTEVGGDDPLAGLLDEQRRVDGLGTLRLSGIAEDDVARLVLATGDAKLAIAAASVARTVHAKTDGHPFMVAELLRWLALEHPPAGRLDELAVPEGVRNLVAQRTARLPERAASILSVASVLGPRFDLDVLARVAGVTEAQALDAIDDCLAGRLLLEVPGEVDRYAFAHDLVRDALRDGLATSRRLRLHVRTAEAIEQLRAGRLEPFLAELAYHHREAAPLTGPGKAIDYELAAGERALTQLAYEDSAAHFSRALAALQGAGHGDETRACDALIGLGLAQQRAGAFVAAQECFAEAVELARSNGNGVQLARAALGRAHLSPVFGTSDERLVAVLEEALQALPDHEDALHARVLSRLATELYFAPSSERAIELTDRALRTARRLGDVGVLSAALFASHNALWRPGRLDERLAVADQMVALAEARGDPELAVYGHGFRLAAHLERGDRALADAALEACGREAAVLRQPLHLFQDATHRGMRLLLEGRYDEADVQLQQTLSEFGSEPNLMQTIAGQTFVLRRDQGRLHELEHAMAAFAGNGDGMPLWDCALALVHADLGRPDEARAIVRRLSAGGFAPLPVDLNWPVEVCVLVEVAARLGDREVAADAYARLLPLAGRVVVLGPAVAVYGAVSHYLALAAAACGRLEEARTHFESALAQHEGMRARPWLARTLDAYAALPSIACGDELSARAARLAGEIGMVLPARA